MKRKNDEDLADICKVALLKRFAGKEYGEEEGEILHRFLREMCERQLVFPFYMEYEESWLREAQIYDKTMVSSRHPMEAECVLRIRCAAVMWKILQTTSASRLPAMPVRMTMAPVRAAMPPSVSGDIHADGRGDGLRQEGGVLLPSEVQREGQSQSAAQAHQSTHGDARDDGGGILFSRPIFHTAGWRG